MGCVWWSGETPLFIDVDSTVVEVHGHDRQGAAYGYTRVLGAHPLLATRADSGFWSHKVKDACSDHGVDFSITVRAQKHVVGTIDAIDEQAWVDIDYTDRGKAQVAETELGDYRLIVRRTKITVAPEGARTDPRLAPPRVHHHRAGETVDLDAEHRAHAVQELAIRDLKESAGLNHCPSGRFNAKAAWLIAATLAHNLLRWVDLLGLRPERPSVTATVRRRLIDIPGRLTRTART